jgi:hypothetical protein
MTKQTEKLRAAFEEWLEAPDQNYRDQASIYWSAFAAGAKASTPNLPALDSDEAVADVCKALIATWAGKTYSNPDAIAVDSAKAAIQAVKKILEGKMSGYCAKCGETVCDCSSPKPLQPEALAFTRQTKIDEKLILAAEKAYRDNIEHRAMEHALEAYELAKVEQSHVEDIILSKAIEIVLSKAIATYDPALRTSIGESDDK